MKYELKQVIYYLHNNKIHSSKVFSRKCVQNAYDDKPYSPCQEWLIALWGESGTFYSTQHGEVSEENAYASKEELINGLRKS